MLKEFKLTNLTKRDYLFLFICLGLYIIFVVLTYQKWGSPIVDCGRDVYVAERILNGDNLYTGVYYVYGPLAPYILSVLFFIFGIHLSVAYWFGIIITLITLFVLYLIAKSLLNSNYAILTIIFSIIAICFNGTIFNFIFPYTYSALIGCFFTVLLAYFLCLLIKSYNNVYLVFIGIITGLLCITKIEFAFAAITSIICYFSLSMFQNGSINKKSLILTFMPLLSIPLLTGLIFLIQSGPEKISKYVNYSRISFNSECSNFFINKILGYKTFISLYIDNLTSIFIVFLLLVILNFFVYMVISNKYKPYIYPLTWLFSIILLTLTIIIFTDVSGSIFSFRHLVIPLVPIIATILIIYYLVKCFVYKNKLHYKDQAIFYFCVLTVCSSFRIFFYYYFSFYSTFYSLLAIIIIFYIVKRTGSYLILKYKTKRTIRYYLNCSFIFIFILSCLNASIINYIFKNHSIETSKGIIKTEEGMSKSFNALITFLNEHDSESKEFLIVPESTLVYFLADKKSPTIFYDYLPIRLTTPEQENYLIKSLKSKNIKTIAITNRSTEEYGEGYWGLTYNQIVYEWIKENYKPCILISNKKQDSGFSRFPDFKILIYQKECAK